MFTETYLFCKIRIQPTARNRYGFRSQSIQDFYAKPKAP